MFEVILNTYNLETNLMIKRKSTTIATVTLLLLGTFVLAQNIQNNVFAEEERDVMIDLTTNPKPTTGKETTLAFTVSDGRSDARISHVDWSVIITHNGKDVFKSQTLHSHAGVLPIGISFSSGGSYDVAVRVASLGPRMLGMDVPAMARTHIMQSDGTPMGWANDGEFDFGTRTAAFTFVVEESGMAVIVDSPNANGKATAGIVSVAGTVPNTGVTIDFSADPLEIVAGEPTTLKFIVTDLVAKLVMHTDAELQIVSGEYVVLRTVGSMSGLHGHTGEVAVTTTFESPGHYIARITAKSIKMSDIQISSYHWGEASASFEIDVKNRVERTESTDANKVDVSKEQNAFVVETESQDAPYYAPNELVVPKGSTIEFINTDIVAHTATSTNSVQDETSPVEDGRFDTGLLPSGKSVVIELNEEGEYNYFCQVHPWMRAKIVVTNA